jgi:hypothetical protein
MNTVLVWVLVTVGGYNGNQVVYSPPMPDLETCEFLKKNTYDITYSRVFGRCIQIKTMVTK